MHRLRDTRKRLGYAGNGAVRREFVRRRALLSAACSKGALCDAAGPMAVELRHEAAYARRLAAAALRNVVRPGHSARKKTLGQWLLDLDEARLPHRWPRERCVFELRTYTGTTTGVIADAAPRATVHTIDLPDAALDGLVPTGTIGREFAGQLARQRALVHVAGTTLAAFLA